MVGTAGSILGDPGGRSGLSRNIFGGLLTVCNSGWSCITETPHLVKDKAEKRRRWQDETVGGGKMRQ